MTTLKGMPALNNVVEMVEMLTGVSYELHSQYSKGWDAKCHSTAYEFHTEQASLTHRLSGDKAPMLQRFIAHVADFEPDYYHGIWTIDAWFTTDGWNTERKVFGSHERLVEAIVNRLGYDPFA